MRETGYYITVNTGDEPFKAFVPHPLPPSPPLALTAEDLVLLSRADREIGRLDALPLELEDPGLLLYFLVRKEAVLSSQIEGTQSSLSELLQYESAIEPGVPLHDVREVSRCVDALSYGVERLGELPLSLRLLRELHARLVADGRGGHQSPGEFRRSQNWIGGSSPGNARHVPPPPDMLLDCLGALESFMHAAPPPYPPLVMAALLHVQFETIHPFLDGNGRVGRIMITLYLLASGALRLPLLYLSLYFKEQRPTYYDLLSRVRTEGAWEEWVRFFLRGALETAGDAQAAIRRLQQQLAHDRKRLAQLGRSSDTALRLHAALARQPIATSVELAKRSGLPVSSVVRAAQRLIELGLLRELTGRQRGRVYSYHAYLAILSEGTEPLPR